MMSDLLKRVDAEIQTARELNPVMAMGMIAIRKMIIEEQNREAYTGVVNDVRAELQTAIETHGLFTSSHHGYAIILEELDELWDEIKKKRSVRDAKNMRAEAVQVAAMAMKFIVSMEAEWKPKIVSENPYKGAEALLKKIEQKCTSCRYDLVTQDILNELGYDPCYRCGEDCREWEPKEVTP